MFPKFLKHKTYKGFPNQYIKCLIKFNAKSITKYIDFQIAPESYLFKEIIHCNMLSRRSTTAILHSARLIASKSNLRLLSVQKQNLKKNDSEDKELKTAKISLKEAREKVDMSRLLSVIVPEKKFLSLGLGAMVVSSSVVMAIPAGFGK